MSEARLDGAVTKQTPLMIVNDIALPTSIKATNLTKSHKTH